MKTGFYFLLLIIAVLIEAVFTSIPLIFILLLNLMVIEKKPWVFAAAFFSGLALDILTLRFLGETGLFFIIFLFIVSLYERKFETANVYFILFSSFLGSIIYLIIFGARLILPVAVIASFIATFIFFMFIYIKTRERVLTHLGYDFEKDKQ